MTVQTRRLLSHAGLWFLLMGTSGLIRNYVDTKTGWYLAGVCVGLALWAISPLFDRKRVDEQDRNRTGKEK